MENPFKFGSVVEGEFFTDRVKEQKYLEQILDSPNHAVLISPRRFGKSSLVAETLRGSDREVISVNLQSVTSTEKLAEALLRKFLAKHPWSKIKNHLSKMRVVPTVSINPYTSLPEVAFLPGSNPQVLLEDALNLIEKLDSPERRIVVLDEFQEILKIDKSLDKQLRSIMQEHKNINYILMGSQEEMMKKIFLRKKSPFYHFGIVIHLERIPEDDFNTYITERLSRIKTLTSPSSLASQILSFTACHPYYTQQLAFQTWYVLMNGVSEGEAVQAAADGLVRMHEFDYARLWDSLNLTNRKVLIHLATSSNSPFENRDVPTSTIQSALKRMTESGLLIKNGKYVIDDPFFKLWIQSQI